MEFRDSRDSFSKIAALYYLADMSQDEIAEVYGISRFKVSRILKKCRSMKIVEFKVNSGPEYLPKLENDIIEKLGVSRAIIVPGGSTANESKANVARRAAKYLEENIKDDMKIGLSWGSTMQLTTSYYPSGASFPKATVVQLSGSLCNRTILGDGYTDGNIFVLQLATKLQSSWSLFMVPFIVQNPALKGMLYEETEIRNHVALFRELDLAIVGIGSEDPAKSVSYISGYLTYEETKKLADEGMAADVCGTRLTIDGEIRETILTNRVLTIDLKDLRRTPEVCAVGAGTEKALSFIAGCRGGYINTVIMDEICALSIINRLRS